MPQDVPMPSVLKKSQVRLASEPAPDGAGPAPAAGGAQVRILAEGETESMIEVTCSCGRKIQVRCAYARAADRGA